ncbi:Toxin-antitoxin system, toxin component, RelE family [uncultured Desulfobacterium sp.]|uniref:Toxin-antitoxin system, toxin component, RelE family n=1 Tax=uncultured Desulfobacterium sp. TaxID=201089 RepID=A0A445MWW5_9BACT|nr:Toxin-antitoxin system, toxin component, RelE family [uncultured Desulfobacterium sp.]
MDIIFKTQKLEKQCNSQKMLVRTYGSPRAGLIRRRLDELRAANSLQDIRYLPQARCHELKGSKKGDLSVDLDHPYRLILRPANEPIPLKADGGLDWANVTAIEIIGVEDTHG